MAALGLEAVDLGDQPDVALGDQLRQRQPQPDVVPGHADDQAQVRHDQRGARLGPRAGVALVQRAEERRLLAGGQQRDLPRLLEVAGEQLLFGERLPLQRRGVLGCHSAASGSALALRRALRRASRGPARFASRHGDGFRSFRPAAI